MGTHSSDLYQLQDINTICHSLGDRPPVKYIWVDLNIGAENHQNKQHTIIFKDNHLKIIEKNSVAKFNREVQRWPTNLYRLRVICAASLPEETYKSIQQTEKVDRAMLFCGNRERATMLMRGYPKIRTACFGSWEVVNMVRLWRKEEETCFFLYDQESIEHINRYYSNVLSLTDSASILSAKAKQQFEELVFRRMPNERRSLERIIEEYQRCRSSRQLMVVFLEKYFLGSPILVQFFNQMLKSTLNPKKLGYLRYIISGIFNTIKNSYSILQQLPNTRYYSIIEVNQAELKKLTQSEQKYIMFTQFIIGTQVQTQRALGYNLIQLAINIAPKDIGRFCSGYLQSQNKIVFNLGTYFKVGKYDQPNKSLELTVLQLSDNTHLTLQKEEHQIYLNRMYQEGQHGKYEGQWYSLLLNHAEQAASEYISQRIKLYQNQQGKIIEYRMNIAANTLKANQTEYYQILLGELERQGVSQSYISCVCIGCEYFFIKEKAQKFQNGFKKIQALRDCITKEELRNKFDLLRIALQITKSPNAQSTSTKLRQLQQLERSFKNSRNYICSELYHFLLRVQLRGYYKLNQTVKSLEIINKLLQIYTVCEGKASIGYVQLSHLKENILATRNGQISQEEMRKKRSLYNSDVNMSLLRNQAYLVEIGGFDLNIYQ